VDASRTALANGDLLEQIAIRSLADDVKMSIRVRFTDAGKCADKNIDALSLIEAGDRNDRRMLKLDLRCGILVWPPQSSNCAILYYMYLAMGNPARSEDLSVGLAQSDDLVGEAQQPHVPIIYAMSCCHDAIGGAQPPCPSHRCTYEAMRVHNIRRETADD
jgi:hypothetical protein